MTKINSCYIFWIHSHTFKASVNQGIFTAMATAVCLLLCQLLSEQIRNSNHSIRKVYVSPEPIDLVYTWVNGSDEQFRANIARFSPVVDESRYNDKDELKYSLRSVQKYASWIRHIYIVTNGQIPHWLNLQNPRISIVSHDEICPPELCSEILPTFSSFAIETLLHRIPNLSQRFIYLNDDVFLGAPLYLDDLITESEGTKIWSAWHLPDCSDGCQWTFIGDKTCDLKCYTAMCHFDGGDCDGEDQNEIGEKEFALVGDSEVKKIVVGINGQIDENYRFSDGPEDKLPGGIRATVSEITDPKMGKDTSVTPSRKAAMDTMLSLKRIDTQSIGRKIVYDHGRTHFLDSLVYSNYILNRRYGFKERRVIAHVGFLLDKAIMKAMINTFPKEFNLTRHHRLRYGRESLQLSFFYFNFLMSEMRSKSNNDIFNEIDVDRSGTWNEREIRALLLQIFPSPLSKQTMEYFQDIVLRCPYVESIQGLNLSKSKGLAKYQVEAELKVPLSRETVVQCDKLMNIIQDHYRMKSPKYKFKKHNKISDESNFVMLLSNYTSARNHLDQVIHHPKLFNCINDDLSHIAQYAPENKAIKKQLSEFYLTLFPNQSQFELDNDGKGFRCVREYRDWLAYKRRQSEFILFVIGNSILIYLFWKSVG